MDNEPESETVGDAETVADAETAGDAEPEIMDTEEMGMRR